MRKSNLLDRRISGTEVLLWWSISMYDYALQKQTGWPLYYMFLLMAITTSIIWINNRKNGKK